MSNKDVQKQRDELAEKFPDGLFLLGLQVENVKRIKAINLDFNSEGGLVVITGDNAQGKSSLLDAVWYGFGGAATLPPDPIREGEKRAKIEMTIGDKEKAQFIVTRNLWYGKRNELKQNIKVSPAEVNSKPYDSPQTMLDALFEITSFDPLAFYNMKASDQRATLLQIAGLDDDLEKLQAEYDIVFAERRDNNRDTKQIEGQLAGLDKPDRETPIEEISITELSRQRDLIAHTQNSRDEAVRDKEVAVNFRDLKVERFVECKDALASAEEAVSHAQDRLKKATEDVEGFSENLDAEYDAITEQLQTAEVTNEKVRAAQHYHLVVGGLSGKKAEAQTRTDQLTMIEERKLKLLEEATFPIKDIAVTDIGVMYQDLPLEQAAQSDQLRVSIALAIARHPNLHLIVSKEGDKLGKARRELLDEMAKTSRHLVLIEKMSEDKSLGIYIEEGEVVREEKTPATSQRK